MSGGMDRLERTVAGQAESQAGDGRRPAWTGAKLKREPWRWGTVDGMDRLGHIHADSDYYYGTACIDSDRQDERT